MLEYLKLKSLHDDLKEKENKAPSKKNIVNKVDYGTRPKSTRLSSVSTARKFGSDITNGAVSAPVENSKLSNLISASSETKKSNPSKSKIVPKITRDEEYLFKWRKNGGITPKKANARIDRKILSGIVHMYSERHGLNLRKSSPTMKHWKSSS